ncbi:heme-binding protein [Rhizobium leguminosarum]|nr:heme-binding protein [Rhizobium leguminosarum]
MKLSMRGPRAGNMWGNLSKAGFPAASCRGLGRTLQDCWTSPVRPNGGGGSSTTRRSPPLSPSCEGIIWYRQHQGPVAVLSPWPQGFRRDLTSSRNVEMDLLAMAKDIADRVEEEASAAKVPVTVTVIDVHGNSVLQHSMNGALAFSMLISHRKTYTAAPTQQRTSDLFELVQPGKELFHLMSQDSFCAMVEAGPLSMTAWSSAVSE